MPKCPSSCTTFSSASKIAEETPCLGWGRLLGGLSSRVTQNYHLLDQLEWGEQDCVKETKDNCNTGKLCQFMSIATRRGREVYSYRNR